DRGIESLQSAVRLLDEHRGGVPADEFMISFLASKAAVYAETIEALVAAGRSEEAFDYCERSRSRALVDMLSARRVAGPGAPRRGVDLADRKIRKLREDLNALYAGLHRVGETGDESAGSRAVVAGRAIAQHE